LPIAKAILIWSLPLNPDVRLWLQGSEGKLSGIEFSMLIDRGRAQRLN
jgi:hypothetical protein